MLRKLKNKFIDEAFEVGIVVKGVFAVIQIIGSFVLLFITPHFIQWAVELFTRDELTEDSTDFFSSALLHLASTFSVHAQIFAFVYLLTHGVVKLILVIALFNKKMWAYPLSIAVFSFFIIYQIYRYFHTYSVWLIIFTIFDIVVVWLVWKEYKLLKESLKA